MVRLIYVDADIDADDKNHYSYLIIRLLHFQEIWFWYFFIDNAGDEDSRFIISANAYGTCM